MIHTTDSLMLTIILTGMYCSPHLIACRDRHLKLNSWPTSNLTVLKLMRWRANGTTFMRLTAESWLLCALILNSIKITKELHTGSGQMLLLLLITTTHPRNLLPKSLTLSLDTLKSATSTQSTLIRLQMLIMCKLSQTLSYGLASKILMLTISIFST